MSDSEDDQRGVPLLEDLSDSPAPTPKKRKRETDDGQIEAKKAAKKARRKAKKPADVDDSALDAELGINMAIGHMDSSLMADHIAQRTKRFQPDLSLVEAEDWRISESVIKDTTGFSKTRTTENLPGFLEQFAGPTRQKKGQNLSHAPPTKGSPHTLVIAGAGLRAADLTRALRSFQTKECLVAKLFAKHIKLKEAIETVQKSRMGIGVGTPQRISDLLDEGALSIAHLERIVVDGSHIDGKKRGVLDMKELQIPLVQLLTRQDLKDKYGKGHGKVELLFY